MGRDFFVWNLNVIPNQGKNSIVFKTRDENQHTGGQPGSIDTVYRKRREGPEEALGNLYRHAHCRQMISRMHFYREQLTAFRRVPKCLGMSLR